MNNSSLLAEEQPITRLVFLFLILLCAFFGVALFAAGKISLTAYTTNPLLHDIFTMDRSLTTEGVTIREIFTKDPKMSLRITPAAHKDSASSSEPPSPERVLEEIRAFKIAGDEASTFPPVVLRYLSAHFDSRRARQSGAFKWSNKSGNYSFLQLKGKNSRALALGVHSDDSRSTTIILASNSEEQLYEEALKKSLGIIFAERELESLASGP